LRFAAIEIEQQYEAAWAQPSGNAPPRSLQDEADADTETCQHVNQAVCADRE
jgi:hypothetical protein